MCDIIGKEKEVIHDFDFDKNFRNLLGGGYYSHAWVGCSERDGYATKSPRTPKKDSDSSVGASPSPAASTLLHIVALKGKEEFSCEKGKRGTL